MESRQVFRATASTFLIGLSAAFLITLGLRLTGWLALGQVVMTPSKLTGIGASLIVAVASLAVGIGLSAHPARDFRGALMGVALVLIAIPLSDAVVTQQWTPSTIFIIALGLFALASGVFFNSGAPKTGSEAISDG